MIPYMVGKLAPNSSHLTSGLVEYIPGRGYFRAFPSQNGDKYVTSPPPSIVELVRTQINNRNIKQMSERVGRIQRRAGNPFIASA